MAFLFSPSAGTQIKVSISATMTVISGAEAVPEFGAEKGTYEVTSISDTAKSFGTDLPDYGEITLTGTWDSTDPAQVYLLGQSAPGVNAVDAFEVDFPKKATAATPAKALFSGLILSFKVSSTKGKQQMFTSKIKLTGVATWTAQA